MPPKPTAKPLGAKALPGKAPFAGSAGVQKAKPQTFSKPNFPPAGRAAPQAASGGAKAKGKGKAQPPSLPVATPQPSTEEKKKKKKKKKEEEVVEDYDYDYDWTGLSSFFGGGAATQADTAAAEQPAADAAPEQSWGAYLGLVDDEPVAVAEAKAPAVTQGAAAAKSVAGAGAGTKGSGKGAAQGTPKAKGSGKGKAAAIPKGKAKPKPKTKAGGPPVPVSAPPAIPKAKPQAKAKSAPGTPRSDHSEPEDILDQVGITSLAENLGAIFGSGAAEEPATTAGAPKGGAAAASKQGAEEEEPTFYETIFGKSDPSAATATTAATDEPDFFAANTGEPDDGLGGITSYLPSVRNVGAAPAAAVKRRSTVKVLPPPPPPEPPPPPISRLRPWAPQLRAAARPRNTAFDQREPPRTDPKVPPLSLNRNVVTSDHRKAFGLPPAEVVKWSKPLRDPDATICVGDFPDELSDPESVGSANSISGDVARSWDPTGRDHRYLYARDTAVQFSDPWRPLAWTEEDWIERLNDTGSYDPEAREDARRLREKQEEEEVQKMYEEHASGLAGDPRLSTQAQAYADYQVARTPRGGGGLPVQRFVQVPNNDPMMRPALADALKAYQSLPRDPYENLRWELEGGTRQPGRGSRGSRSRSTPAAPWDEPDALFDKPTRAWL